MSIALPALASVLLLASPAMAAPGDLDGGFATGGIRSLAVGPKDANLSAVVKQADGKIVAAGFAEQSASAPENRDVLVVRLTSAGALDPSFNAVGAVPGVLTFPVSGGTQDDVANALALGPGGTIYVAGQTDPAGGGDSSDMFVARVTGGGAVDTGFSTDGFESLSLGTFGDSVDEIAIQDDGKVVVAGTGGTAEGGMIVARLDGTTGGPDASFGAGGPATGVQEVVFTAGFGSDPARGLALLPGGAIVVAGTANQSSADDDFALARLTSAGVLDTASGFGGGTGKARTTGGVKEIASDLTVDGSGRLVVAGAAATGGIVDFHVARYSATGVLDGGFAGDGTATTAFVAADGTRFAQATGVAVDGDGRVVATGLAFVCSAAGCADTAVARHLGDGTLDPAFSGDGKVTHDLTGAGRNDFSTGAVLGTITVVGFGFGGASEFGHIARLLSCCPADPPPLTTPTTDPNPANGFPPPLVIVPGPPTPPGAPRMPIRVAPNRLESCDPEDYLRELRRLERIFRRDRPSSRAAQDAKGKAFNGRCTLPARRGCPAARGLQVAGSDANDTLLGTRQSDTLRGVGGVDVLRGGEDNDLLLPGPGRDREVLGEGCDDVIFDRDRGSAGDVRWDGGAGDDLLNGKATTMRGGTGDDVLLNGLAGATSDGGAGADVIVVTAARRTSVKGGRGADKINARNRSRDAIDCGAGPDIARIDAKLDVTRDCEKVIRVG